MSHQYFAAANRGSTKRAGETVNKAVQYGSEYASLHDAVFDKKVSGSSS